MGRVRRFILGPFSFSEFLRALSLPHRAEQVLCANSVNARINQTFARLESWHLILRSDQKGPNPQASHGYLPKRYLFDTGILRELRESAVPALSAALAVNRKHMRGLVGYLRLHGLRSGHLVSLAPHRTDTLDEVEVVNLPAYLLERLATRPRAC